MHKHNDRFFCFYLMHWPILWHLITGFLVKRVFCIDVISYQLFILSFLIFVSVVFSYILLLQKVYIRLQFTHKRYQFFKDALILQEQIVSYQIRQHSQLLRIWTACIILKCSMFIILSNQIFQYFLNLCFCLVYSLKVLK